MNDKRRCKYPGCDTVLRKGKEGDYCAFHEAEEYISEIAPKKKIKDTISSREKMYTVQDLMRILKYSDKTIRNMLNLGEIAGLRIGTRGKWLVFKSELDRFKKEGPGKDTASRGLLSTEEIKEQDIRIFRQGDSIMSEEQVKYLLWRLQHEQRYSATDFTFRN
jgi:hypothetical protein